MMELKIKEITFPEVIEFNFDELKEEITSRVEMYKNLVYSEEQIKEAKSDRANLNKFVKAIADERLRVKRQCLQPYEEFERKINELTQIVQQPISLIDAQIKSYEEKLKAEKLENIKDYFGTVEAKPAWLVLSQILNQKWLNASVSLKSVYAEIDQAIEHINQAVDTLINLPEFGFEAVEVYKTTLDMNKAILEAKRMADIAEAKRLAEIAEAEKREQEKIKLEDIPPETVIDMPTPTEEPQEQRQWVKFQAYLTVQQAKDLKWFFETKGIEFKAI